MKITVEVQAEDDSVTCLSFVAAKRPAKLILSALAAFYSSDRMTIFVGDRTWSGEADTQDCYVWIAAL